jgi:hypothetical protein
MDADPQPALEQFYSATKHLLPPTPAHSDPSPLSAFHYTYSLITTRTFLIDLYHTLALVPFSDILNHSSHPHTTLGSDDFVCHICGSLAPCSHDIQSTSGVVMRLRHLEEDERRRIAREEDCVEMKLERSAERGEEIYNTYGENIGDGRLLVEWGFVEGEFAGEGLTWEMNEVAPPSVWETWAEIMERGTLVEKLFDLLEPKMEGSGRDTGEGDSDSHSDNESVEGLICLLPQTNPTLLNLTQNGQISLNLWSLIYLAQTSLSNPATLDDEIAGSIRDLDTIRRHMRGGSGNMGPSSSPSMSTISTARIITKLLESRRSGMYCSESSLDELFELRDVSRHHFSLSPLSTANSV